MIATRTAMIPDGVLRHKVVMRQSPPAPVAFTATSTTQTMNLLGIPAKHVIVGVRASLVASFVANVQGIGNTLTTCTVSIGSTSLVDSNVTSTNYYSPAFSCTQAVSTTSFTYWSPLAMLTTDPQLIQATFTSVGAQLAAITAGEIHFTIMYRPL